MAAHPNLARWTAALALGLGALACGRADSALPAADEAPAPTTQAATAPLLTLMADAPTSVEFLGVRRYEVHWTSGGAPQQLAYREEVAADGQGQTSVKALEVLAPPMNTGQEAMFVMTQNVRHRMMYFVRDFGVRDLGLFATNYSLVDTGVPTSVAGVPTQRVVVAERDNPDRRYLLDVDVTNGLVLSAREELLDGTLVSLSEYETIDYAPDLSNYSWADPLGTDEQDLVPGSTEAMIVLGFKARLPKVVPAGWDRVGFSKLTDPHSGEVWAKAVYSNGVEQIFYLVAKGDGPQHQLKNPPPGTPPSHADRVSKMFVGNWTLLDADLAQGKALLLGRTADGVLEDLLQSALF